MNDADPAATSEQPTPTQDPAPAPTSGPRVSRDEMKDLGRLRRSVTDRHIAGVAGGIARHLDIDAIIVRVALVVGVFFGGAGLLLYVGAWLLVPEEGTEDEPLGLDRRSRSIAIVGVGILALLAAVGDWAGASWFPWPVAIVAALVVWFLHRKDKNVTRPQTGYGYAEPGYTETSYADPTYAEPTYAETSYADSPPTYGHPTYARGPHRPRNPRKRGPRLFLFTVALIALAEGVLGVVDLAGAGVAGSAYPALALGIVAAMLLVGSVWGRAGGLIAVGLVAAVATAAATAADSVPGDRLAFAPTRAADVRETYNLGVGELTLDLSRISDVDALDGRDITVEGVGGELEVIVPDGVDVTVRSQSAAGDTRVFDQREDGFDVIVDGFLDGGDDVPDLTLNVEIAVGDIVVREAA
jgi:phage shock protein PspC (stress-responsive transcriptional regulator)